MRQRVSLALTPTPTLTFSSPEPEPGPEQVIASLDYPAERRLIRANELHVQGCSPRWGHYAEALLRDDGATEGPSSEEGAASECASSLVFDAHGLWRQAYATDLLMTCLVVVLMVGGMMMISSQL